MAAPQDAGDRPKRNRIIINLERAREAAHIPHLPKRGSRGARVLALVGILLALLVLGVALGAFFWWQNYKTKPAYSLALLVDAAQTNDQAAFDQLVDTDAVVNSFVPQVVDKAIGRAASSVVTAVAGSVREKIEALVPKLMPAVKQQVRAEVVKGVKELSERAEGKPFFLIALAMPFIVDINEEGDSAQVNANLKDRAVQLTMKRNGDHWKIVAVKDEVMAGRIVDSIWQKIVKEIPAALPEIKKQMEKNLPKDMQKNLPKNVNAEDIRKNLPNVPGVTDNGNGNANSNQ